MNRNVESRFALAPDVSIGRSKIRRPNELKTSFNVGDVVPIYLDEVLPGDTHIVKTSQVVRLQTPITPFMDNIYLDTYYYFVPMRLVWEHTKEFYGENTQSAWIPQAQYTIPQIVAPSGGWNVGTLADYFGLPTGVGDISVSALPFRSYALIMNEFFRSTALTDPLYIPVGDATQTGSNGGSYVTDVANGGLPFKAAKYHDYFTSALPGPQYGPDVFLGLGGEAPVVGNGLNLGLTDGTGFLSLNWTRFTSNYGLDMSAGMGKIVGSISGQNTTDYPAIVQPTAQSPAIGLGVPTKTQLGDDLAYSGLVADLGASGQFGFSINMMRTAFQIQKFYEKQARSGSRMIETIKAMFGVDNPDYRLQRPEYLGGNRVPLAVNQVVQTSQSGTTPQGYTAAYSVTSDVSDSFTKSFTEPGYIIGLAVARYDHSYQDGIERFWSRKDKFDFYWPVFASLGEMGIKNKEIFAQGSSVVDADGNIVDDQIFGYQEAWADYRYKPSHVTGEMRSKYATSLDVWHLGDDYSQLPTLSDGWIREDKSNVDRVLQVTSSVSNQLFGDFFFDTISVRPMPVYSIPGLIDHH